MFRRPDSLVPFEFGWGIYFEIRQVRSSQISAATSGPGDFGSVAVLIFHDDSSFLN